MKKLLSHPLSRESAKHICALMEGFKGNHLKEELYLLTKDTDRRVATNALWVFTHFPLPDNEWLFAKHDELIDRSLGESDTTKLRLMLCLLLRQPLEKESIRADFIDFCVARLADAGQPYAIRAQAMKLAWEQMRYWPEMVEELQATLLLVARAPLSPGLRSAWRQVMRKIDRLLKKL